MSSEQEVVSSVLDEFSVNCQHIGGKECFVPTNAVKSFVSRCKTDKLVMAHGEVYAPQDGLVPVVVMLPDDVYRAVAKLAASSKIDIPELTAHCLVSVIGSKDAVAYLGSIIAERLDSPPDPGEQMELPPAGSGAGYADSSELVSTKVANASDDEDDIRMSTERDEPPEPWSFSMDYGKVSESVGDSDDAPGAIVITQPSPIPNGGSGGVSVTPASAVKQAVYQIKDKLEPLSKALSAIHAKRSGDIDIDLSLSVPNGIGLRIQYPVEGYDVICSFEGTLDQCIEQVADKLTRWGSVAFGPKLENGQAAAAKVSVKIIEFDQTKGKYKAQIGEAVVWLDPEFVGTV